MKSLILYDEELYANGLELLLNKVDKSLEIVKQSLTNDCYKCFDGNIYTNVFLIKSDNNVEESIVKILDYNPATNLFVIMGGVLRRDIRLFKKYNLAGMLEKKYDGQRIGAIIKLAIMGDRYFPTDMLISDKIELTENQAKILTMASEGYSNKQIAYDMNLAESTVKNHFSKIMKILHCSNRVEAIRKAIEMELIG